MTKEVKDNKKVVKRDSYETLKALYYSGKVKPSLNKIVVELKNDPENFDLLLLACQCLVRTKNFNDLSSYADKAIAVDKQSGDGYYYKGIALHNLSGKEQDALKNFKEALTIDPENTIYLKGKAETHLSLFKDYHLPINFAEKHRVKAEECLQKIVELIEQKESPSYMEYLTIADVNIMLSQNIEAKKYYIKAVNAFEASEETPENMNIYKDIIKGQKACIRITQKSSD